MKLAIMKGVGFGCRDVGMPVLWFSACTSESSESLQVLSVGQALQVIEESGCYDVHDLEGKACWVEEEGAFIHFKGIAKI